MEKISGILPPTPRVQSVNLREAQPVRPGAPAFGSPTAKAALNGGPGLSTAEKAGLHHEALMRKRSGDAFKPDIIEDLNNKFFLKNKTEAPVDPVEDFDLNYTMDRTTFSQPSNKTLPNLGLRDPSAEIEMEAALQPYQETQGLEEAPQIMMSSLNESEGRAEEDTYTPPGTYLDVSV